MRTCFQNIKVGDKVRMVFHKGEAAFVPREVDFSAHQTITADLLVRKIDAGEIDADDRERHGDMQRGPDP